MISLVDKSKTTFFNYFYVFCIIIYAGSATVFTRELGDIRTIGNAFALVISILFFIKNHVYLSRNYLLSVLVFLFYAIITSLNNKRVNPFWISQWLIWLTIAYGLCKGLGTKFFVTIETVLYHLCIISLILWFLQLLYPSLIESLVRTLNFSKPYGGDYANNTVAANMIVYTLSTNVGMDAYDSFFFFHRNPGFAWEPGAFACFACLGLYCNIIRKNFRLKDNRVFWVFFVALLSTQSTTGLMTFILMIGVWLIANRNYYLGFLAIPVVLAFFSLPFVGGKLQIEFQSLDYIDLAQSKGALNRTYSLYLDYQEFLRHPIIGLGGWAGGTYIAQMGYEVSTISGIGDLLVRFGAIMTLLFVFILFKSSKCINNIFDSQNGFILIALMLGMMYSYSLWSTPLFIACWMFWVYCPKVLNNLQSVYRINSYAKV